MLFSTRYAAVEEGNVMKNSDEFDRTNNNIFLVQSF